MKDFQFLANIAGALLASFFLGCGAEGAAESSPPGDTATIQTPAPIEKPGADTVAETNAPRQTRPVADPQLGVPGDGEPGSIKGILKSPYTRLAEGVVYITTVKGRQFALSEENPIMDQKNKIFIPHLLPVQAGSTVEFPNTDDVRHSVYSRDGSAVEFNLGQYDAGVVKRERFEETGVTHLGCNVHTEMSAFIVSFQNPFFALANRRGEFTIPNIPPGRYQLTFFHERIVEKIIVVSIQPGEETYVEFTGLKRK